MGINKYNQLLKNSDFLYKYQIMIDEILENFNSKVDDSYILQREAWWKKVLCSKEFGYNDN